MPFIISKSFPFICKEAGKKKIVNNIILHAMIKIKFLGLNNKELTRIHWAFCVTTNMADRWPNI